MTDTIEPVVLDEDEKQAWAQRLVDQAKAEAQTSPTQYKSRALRTGSRTTG